ncbi:AarF/ABC1/UbiB kinase family protein [Salipiger sp. IMCC34102]|nr:AarF/ABC1/UbiB kinase family protein [Salipiger sp. IMCC34102]
MARLGGLAGGIAGRAAYGGLKQIAGGKGLDPRDLLLTPANAQRIAGELAKMRGAAMKVGQLLSMDAGEVLPPEIATLLDRLRSDADPMPPRQLREVLNAEWGRDWLQRFRRFDVRPIAAASIGQVHRAVTKDGRDLALKVQYPGVRASIDSDIANIAGLIKWSGAAPKGMDLAPLMADARAQLHEEADYAREGRNLDAFAAMLGDDPAFRVPARHPDLCTPNVLAMDFAPGTPVERRTTAPQDLRDETARRLVDLTLRELFVLGRMQTDPNFANYLVEDGGRIVLLDFGAVRDIPPEVQTAFRRLMHAGLSRDRTAAEAALEETGLIGPGLSTRQRETVLSMFDLAMTPLRTPGAFDFGASDLPRRLRDMGLEMGDERTATHVPPVTALLIQRKVAGMYLLAARLRARVDLATVVERYARESLG